MTLYEVDAADGEPSITFGNFREARRFAKEMAREVTPRNEKAVVRRITTVAFTKAAIVRLINNAGGYVVTSEFVEYFKSTRVYDDD